MAAEVAQQPPPPSAAAGGDAAGTTTATRKLLFGKYEMGRLLGKGTFAKVYCAKNVSTNESFAIKVLSKDHIRREGLVDQILREISALRLVRHPHVVHLQEVMATRSQIFFVMELVRGGELFAKVASGKLKEDVARSYFQQLISAVDFCHSRGVSHRDLKPENLLLDDDGNLKISDFGLSALPEQRWTDGLLHTQCGTPAYVAPEVLRKKGYDGAKADLWSCGVILYVLLAGFLPFQHENLMMMYAKIFKAEFEWPRWFSAGARRLISRLLVADPEKRITMDGILKDPWFNKGYITCPAENDSPLTVPAVPAPAVASEKGPAFYNAFELISAMSSGFDLSGMFETGKKAGTIFTSRRSAGEIIERLQEVGRGLGFEVLRDEVYYRVRLAGKREARVGRRLVVTAEVFQVAPDVAVVEFSQSAGDTFEYLKFCEVDVRPGLRDIVWTWQGE